MAPPGLAPAPTRRNHVNGSRDTAVGAALISRYVGIAKAQPETGRHARQQGRDLIGYVVSYADPTADTAIRNVDRERGW